MATFVSRKEEGKEGEQRHSFRAWFTILDDQGRREKLLKLLMLIVLVSQWGSMGAITRIQEEGPSFMSRSPLLNRSRAISCIHAQCIATTMGVKRELGQRRWWHFEGEREDCLAIMVPPSSSWSSFTVPWLKGSLIVGIGRGLSKRSGKKFEILR